MSEVYTTREVALLFEVSERTLQRRVLDGNTDLPYIRVGRDVRWPRAPIDKMLGLSRSEAPDAHSGAEIADLNNCRPAATGEPAGAG